MHGRLFSRLVGIFSILNTIQVLIFDLKETTFLGFEHKFDIYMDQKSGLPFWVLVNRKKISIGLSTVTIVVSALLLYCVHVNKYIGLLCYPVWIIPYELSRLSMVLLVKKIMKEQFVELSYLHLIFQVSHMLLHFFCLHFVIKHGYSIYLDLKNSSKRSPRKHSINIINS